MEPFLSEKEFLLRKIYKLIFVRHYRALGESGNSLVHFWPILPVVSSDAFDAVCNGLNVFMSLSLLSVDMLNPAVFYILKCYPLLFNFIMSSFLLYSIQEYFSVGLIIPFQQPQFWFILLLSFPHKSVGEIS
jgi:hypothetical protein